MRRTPLLHFLSSLSGASRHANVAGN